MKDKKPQISVIIPAYRAEKYISEAIESVLNQTIKPIEVIVVDDGSPDNTSKIVSEKFPEITLLKQENRGAGAARNKGLKHAKGSVLSFLDADDFYYKNAFEVLLKQFQKRPSCEIVFGRVEQFISPEITDSLFLQKIIKSDDKQAFLVGSGLFKRSVFDKVGEMNESLKLAEFIDWIKRAEDIGVEKVEIPDVVLKRRLHENNQGRLNKAHIQDYTKVLRAVLARKKGKNL